ncbi:MAG: peptidylprolyl isomerase [Bacteroidia bacterium]|jgi:peptidyl-prolyl cis-trans isomerase SurA|nr:peptidylprolyl isomerase [Bacteroidia bacterium]
MMMPFNKKKLSRGCLSLSLFLLLLLPFRPAMAQPGTDKVVDQVVAVVGAKIILLSDIEAQYQQLLGQTSLRGDDLRCKIVDQLLLNKLLAHQAEIDSVEVGEDQVEQKINQNMSYFIQQIGSAEKLEAYYGKSIAELKEEFRPMIREQLVVQQMQGKITGGVTASPADVKSFFNNIPEDSLPLINAEVEYAQILKKVPVSAEEKKNTKEKLNEFRDRILKGEEFSTLAILYSQDIESAKQGGELGFVNRGDLVPEFEAAAFRLKNITDVSPIIETQFGFHIIQLIERRGDRINCRHILLHPKVSTEDLVKTQLEMDSLAKALRAGTITFAEAAEKYSDDKDTKLNAGNVVNPASGATKFESDQVDPAVLFQLDKMEIGEISNPIMTTTREGDNAYRILLLKTRSQPHRLNLKDDYNRLQELAVSDKQNRILETWRNKKKALTYIRISEDYKNCPLLNDWASQ